MIIRPRAIRPVPREPSFAERPPSHPGFPTGTPARGRKGAPFPLPRITPPDAECAIPDPEYRMDRLANGLTVATFPMPWLHEIGITLTVRAGSRFEEPRESGIAHFLEHMLFKGTERIPDPTDLHTCLEAYAADMNAATGQENNAYWISLPPEWVDEAFSLFCEIFTRPALNGIEIERQVILAEMREDENDQGETTHPMVLGGAHLWPGHPLSRSILGARETIEGIGPKDLRAYLNRHYHGSNMAASFFGPIRHEEALALAQRTLGSLPGGTPALCLPPPPMIHGPHWVAINDQTAQFSISLFFRGSGYREELYYPMASLRRILDDGFSSRLQARLREQRGLVYDLWASVTAYSDTGTLELGASVSPENLLEVFSALFQELELLRRHPPEEDEWERLLTRWRVWLATTLDRPGELVERYVADRLFDAMEPLTDSWRRVRTMDRLTLPALVRSLTRPENLVVVLVGPEAKTTLPVLQRRFAQINARATY